MANIWRHYYLQNAWDTCLCLVTFMLKIVKTKNYGFKFIPQFHEDSINATKVTKVANFNGVLSDVHAKGIACKSQTPIGTKCPDRVMTNTMCCPTKIRA